MLDCVPPEEGFGCRLMLWARRETEQMLKSFFRVLGPAFFLGEVCFFAAPIVCGAEQSWELRGDLIAVGGD